MATEQERYTLAAKLADTNIRQRGEQWLIANYGSRDALIAAYLSGRHQGTLTRILDGRDTFEAWAQRDWTNALTDPNSPASLGKISPIAGPGSGPADAPPEVRGAFESLKQQLEFWGLGSLAGDVWNLVKQGEPQSSILTFVYQSPQFKERFAGIFDPAGGFKISPSEYIEYEKGLKSLLASYGMDPKQMGVTFEQLRTDLIAGDRALTEVKEDLDMFTALDQDAALRREFYAITGTDPRPEGVFALMMGLPWGQSLQKVYQDATKTGVYDDSVAMQRRGEFDELLTQERAERMRTFQQAFKQARAHFEGGGFSREAVEAANQPIRRTF